jgi:hypothetical protein
LAGLNFGLAPGTLLALNIALLAGLSGRFVRLVDGAVAAAVAGLLAPPAGLDVATAGPRPIPKVVGARSAAVACLVALP